MATYVENECPVCGCKHYKKIGTVNEKNSPVSIVQDSAIVKCKKCKLIYVNPMPYWSAEDFSKLYDETYFTHLNSDEQQQWLNIRQNTNTRIRYGIIQKHLKAKGKRMLEIGAGEYAFMCRYLKDKGWDVSAQEPSSAYRGKLSDISENNHIHVEERSVLEIDGEEDYALIYADSVLEHVPDPIAYYKKIASLLEPGGVLYTISPNEHSWENTIKNIFAKIKGEQPPHIAPYREPYHLTGFTKEALTILAEKSGLTLASYKKFNDYKAYHMWKSNRSPLIKYPVAILFALADKCGGGTNGEAVFVKQT